MKNLIQEAALRYAQRGWSVIPIDGKKPLVPWKAYQAERAEEAQIADWFSRFPKANIGIVTGTISGLVVLDIDAPEGLKTLAEHNFILPKNAAQSKTGRDGFHFFFAHPGYTCKNFAAGRVGDLLGVDFRGDGGYVVVPPSIHPNGKNYQWIKSPEEALILPLPSWLEQRIRSNPVNNDNQNKWEGNLLKGHRNTGLAQKIGSLLKNGLSSDQVLEFILVWNQKHCQPPLERKEVEAIVASIADRHAGQTKQKTSQAQQLVELTSTVELFHTNDRKAYATVPCGSHQETLKVHSQPFSEWLTHYYYIKYNQVPKAQTVRDVMGMLGAKAQLGSPELPIHLRVAKQNDDTIFIDLGCSAWDVIKVKPSGWQILPSTKSPVKFWRSPGMLPLTRPSEENINVSALREFLNFRTEEDWYLLVAWLLSALRPIGPYPILVLQGEQGSAKSTTAKVLSALVDPSTPQLRIQPNDVRDLAIAASNTWVLTLDNISRIPSWLSDVLCSIATEAGYVTRKLYSDDEEMRFVFTRPIIINSIDMVVKKHDLLDRSIVITLPSIPESNRRSERDFWIAFEQAKPEIFAGLLNAITAGLYHIENVEIDGLPRMAEFAEWVSACEPALPWQKGEFMKAYAKNRKEAVEVALESDVVVEAIKELLEQKSEWEGTTTELLNVLEDYTPEQTVKEKSWPKTVNLLGRRLRLSESFLRQVGIKVEFARVKSGQKRTIKISRI